MKTKPYPLKAFNLSDKISSVLLIDNNEIDNFINQKILESYGIIDVFSFRNAASALDHLTQTDIKYQLILVDIYMPFTDGFEFVAKFNELRLDKKHGEVCLLSATINPIDTEKAKDENLKFIEKPLTIEKIIETLKLHT